MNETEVVAKITAMEKAYINIFIQLKDWLTTPEINAMSESVFKFEALKAEIYALCVEKHKPATDNTEILKSLKEERTKSIFKDMDICREIAEAVQYGNYYKIHALACSLEETRERTKIITDLWLMLGGK